MFALLKQSDARAVRQVLRGRRDQFDTLVQRYLPAVYAVSYAQLRNHADAEDVTQEAFLAAFTSLHTLREPHKFEGWVVSMARRTAVHLRQKRQRQFEPEGRPVVEAVTIPDAARDELRQLLRQEIDRLDSDDREILLLHYFTGKSAGEISVALGIGREAAKKRLQRARQQLSDSMLRYVEDETKPKVDFAKQQNTIAGLIAIAAIPWADVAAASQFPLASAGATKPVAIVVLAGLLVAGGIYLANRDMRNGDEIAISGPSEAQQVASIIDDERSLVVEESVSSQQESNSVPDVVEVASEIPNSAGTLEGLWRACDNLGVLADIRFLSIVHSEENISLYAYSNGEITDNLASGTIENGEIMLSEVAGDSIPLLSGHFSGGDTFTLTGELSELGTTASLEIAFTRPTERDLAELEIEERRIGEVETVAKALQAYASASNGAKPATLAELSPTYLPASQLAESSASRRVLYAPDGIPHLVKWTDQYDQLATHVEKLMKLEADRKAAWWNYPSMPSLLSVQYSTPPMVLESRSIERPSVRRIDNFGGMACPAPTTLTELKGAAMQASCANNMKQLGIVLKMFQAEDRESRFPAGWASTVPDYLLDTMVLTCPSLGEEDGPGRTVSYKLLFPTGTEEGLIELFAEVDGMADGEPTRATAMGNLPLVIEEHECSESGGSQVLFLDGHVELITSDEWDTRIAPFVALSGIRISIESL